MLLFYNYNSFRSWLYRIMDHRLFWFWQAFGDLVGYGSKPNPFTLFLIKILRAYTDVHPKKIMVWLVFSAIPIILQCLHVLTQMHQKTYRIWDLVLHSKNPQKNSGHVRTSQVLPDDALVSWQHLGDFNRRLGGSLKDLHIVKVEISDLHLLWQLHLHIYIYVYIYTIYLE